PSHPSSKTSCGGGACDASCDAWAQATLQAPELQPAKLPRPARRAALALARPEPSKHRRRVLHLESLESASYPFSPLFPLRPFFSGRLFTAVAIAVPSGNLS